MERLIELKMKYLGVVKEHENLSSELTLLTKEKGVKFILNTKDYKYVKDLLKQAYELTEIEENKAIELLVVNDDSKTHNTYRLYCY